MCFRSGSRLPFSSACHALSRWADEIILFGIIVNAVVVERIGTVSRTLFEMEPVVLHVGFHSGFVHEAVVLLGSVTRVGDSHGRQTAVTVKERIEEGYERERVGGIGKQSEVGVDWESGLCPLSDLAR